MDIVLDTNIFRSDILLRSKDFDILLDFLDKTGSSLIMPQIILDEVKGIYSRVLTERIVDLNKASTNINLALTEETIHIKPIEIDVSAEVLKYELFIKTKFKIKDRHLLPYNNEYLPEIATRAIKRQKPSGDKGQGFRDTLIWLTIKDYTIKCHEKQITFISNNTEDFAAQDKSTLHELLATECNSLGVRINYFRSVREFVENHSSKIDFITYDWLSENLDYDLVGDMVLDEINGRTKSSITSWFRRKTSNESTDHYKALSVHPYSDTDLFVYEMVDNTLVINVTVHAEIEIEFEYYQDDVIRGMDLDDYHYHEQRRHSNTVQYLDTELYVILTMQDGEVTDTELSGWDHY